MNPMRMKRIPQERIWMFCSLMIAFKPSADTGPDWRGLISPPLRVAHDAQSRRMPRPIIPPLSTHSTAGSCDTEGRGAYCLYRVYSGPGNLLVFDR